ncbi:MAG: hypothetical protein JST84_01430 [Acidobacteria bacterium]|nr:hypothetical protein [Acidobacteriota bacterium]
MKARLTLATILLCLSGIAEAQTQPASALGGRNKPGFVYDSARKKFVLFGGFGKRGEGIKGDTWEWSGQQWACVNTSGPGPRGAMGMAYDTKHKRTILFGGFGTTQLGDTWEWDGKHWVEIQTSGPSARGGIPSLAYDTHRKKTVLFGGWDASGPVADIWEWDGKRWLQVK